MTSLVQLPDQPNTDASTAEYLGFGSVDFAAGQFTMTTCAGSGRIIFGQIASAQRNYNRSAPGPLENATINMLERIGDARLSRDVGVNEVHHYTVTLLKDVSDGTSASVTKRPQIGSMLRAATTMEIVQHVGLPQPVPAYTLGALKHTDVTVGVSQHILRHHVLTAGTTGAGKSNTLANIIAAAQAMGHFVIVYDHKPDYQNMHEPNDEGLEDYYRGLSNVDYWYLGREARRDGEQPITVPASLLSRTVLAHTVCYQPDESRQAEALVDLLEGFNDLHGEQTWTIEDFRQWLPSTSAACATQYGIEVHQETYRAIRQKIRRTERVPSWIDGPVSAASRAMFRLGHFNLEHLAQPGVILVIRIDSSAGGGRGYGLFLSYLLKEAYRLREHHLCKAPLTHIIDEAQDIFGAGRAFQQAAGTMLDENMRKGRSMHIGFVLGAQSAKGIPAEIRNLLNSQILHRHGSSDIIREAMPMASEEQMAVLQRMGPGEALCFLFGSNAVVHTQMRRAPFKLTKLEDFA